MSARTFATSVLPTPASPSRNRGRSRLRARKTETPRERSATYPRWAKASTTSSTDRTVTHYGRNGGMAPVSAPHAPPLQLGEGLGEGATGVHLGQVGLVLL